jgi:hypothetical protein
MTEKDLLVLISHDCDICHGSLDEEPNIEVMVARHLPSCEENGNYLHGKNPRRLQFWTTVGAEHRLYEMRAFERATFPRRLLAQSAGAGQSVTDVKLLQRWLARRYHRTALPSAFNQRCTLAQEHLLRVLKTKHKAITGIYLQLSSRDELPEDQDYRVVVHLIVKAATFERAAEHAAAIQVKAAVQKAFARCTGIELEDVQLWSEAEMTLDDVARLVQWDYSDYLSQREGTSDGVAPQAYGSGTGL